MTRRALVLGAGGHAAIAWEVGIVAGLADVGIDVRDAETVVGTSAGSLVGAQITSGLSLEELFHRQVDPDLQTKESPPLIDFARWRADFKVGHAQANYSKVALRRSFCVASLELPATLAAPVRRSASVLGDVKLLV
jgi:NTE family protein